MNLITINDIKITMAMLLGKDVFNKFLLDEAEVMTYAKLTLNGRRNMKWYDTEEIERGLSEFIKWGEIRQIFFDYIKGSKTPEYFKVSLKADDIVAKQMLEDSGCYDKYVSLGTQLHMQIRYGNDVLQIVTGVYNSQFTMDKTVENAWDNAVKEWIKALGISFE